jgi:hypothetical protein
VSVLFGIIGLLYLGYYKWVLIIVGSVTGILILLFALKKINMKGFSIEILLQEISRLLSIHI